MYVVYAWGCKSRMKGCMAGKQVIIVKTNISVLQIAGFNLVPNYADELLDSLG